MEDGEEHGGQEKQKHATIRHPRRFTADTHSSSRHAQKLQKRSSDQSVEAGAQIASEPMR